MHKSAITAARRGGLGVTLALALVAGIPAAPAAATTSQDCSCLITSQEEQRAQADVVFKGTLDSTKSVTTTDSNGVAHSTGQIHTFTPSSVYDGTVYNPQDVVQPPDMDPKCGVAWEGPGPYLVFAEVPSESEEEKYDLRAGELLLKPCGGTRPIDADDEPSFGPGTPVSSDDEATTAAQDRPARTAAPEDEEPEFPLPGFRYLTNLLDDTLVYVGQDPEDDEDTPVEGLLGRVNGDDDDDGLLEELLELLGLDDDDDDSPFGDLFGDDDDGLLEQLLELLGLADDDDDEVGLLLIDPATLQEQLDKMGLPDPNGAQEQLKELGLPQGPGGEDGDAVSVLDPGNLGGLIAPGEGGTAPTPFDLGGLGGIGTPPPPGAPAS